MNRYLFFALLFFLLLNTSHAQNTDQERIAKFLAVKPGFKPNDAHKYLEELFPEWNFKSVRYICMMIGDRTASEVDGSKLKYMIEDCFYAAAKVDRSTDNDEAISKKISAMWKVYQQTGYTGCNASTFDIREGNILKYAVADKFEEFLEDAIKWKLDLNKVDFYDQMTLLDYIEYNISRAKGSALEARYQKYYNMFRKAGAKHKKEL